MPSPLSPSVFSPAARTPARAGVPAVLAGALRPVLLAGVLATAAASPLPAQRNSDFEAPATGRIPGWLLPTPGFRARRIDRDAAAGTHAVELTRRGPAGGTGNLMQMLDATEFRGRLVRFEVDVEVPDADTLARLWMRVDRPDGQLGFFDSMADRPVRQTTWRRVTLIGKVAADARRIAIGMMVQGSRARFDNVTFQVLPGAIPQGDAPRPLTPTGLDNLVAFGRLSGAVRYFHPSSEATACGWDRFLVDGVREIEAADTPTALRDGLRRLFAPIAPTVAIATGAAATADHPSLKPLPDAKAVTLRTWKHVGIGLEVRSIYASEPEDNTLRGEAARRAAPTVIHRTLPRGLAYALPTSLFCADGHTRPRAQAAAPRPAALPPDPDDRAARLAAVIEAWNVFQHFYPYFDVTEVDWDAQLRVALHAAATDTTPRQFLDTLRRLVAALRDGHGNVFHNSDDRDGQLPMAFAFIEGKMVVVATQTPQVRVGEVLEAIEDQSTDAWIRATRPTISAATEGFARYRLAQELRRGPVGTVALTVTAANGSQRTILAEYTRKRMTLREKRPAKIAELRPGVLYVDVDRVRWEDLEKAMPRLVAATGIVFDFRGYPSSLGNPHAFFGHMVEANAQSARWLLPMPTEPDRRGMEFRGSGRWKIPPRQPKWTAKKVFLIDGRAISYAESCMGIVEHEKLGAIVGETTAGTNGNINPFTVVGGYRIVWTGMKVLKHDGSQHHGVGIRPTIPVTRTLAGVRAGRDEILERGLAALEGR